MNYCLNGCTRRHGDEQLAVATEGKSQLCVQCEGRLGDWLGKIPDTYALLPTFLEHGTTDKNPESKTTKAANAPAPMRLDVIDLLDERRGRKWLGTAATEDRRGVLGTLWANVDRLAEERPLEHVPAPSVPAACLLLNRHRLWLAEQDWSSDLYEDVRTIHRQLADATGDYRRKPVGRCHIIPEQAETPCNGPLFANPYGGVHCTRCDATWDPTHLRQLGLAQAEKAG